MQLRSQELWKRRRPALQLGRGGDAAAVFRLPVPALQLVSGVLALLPSPQLWDMSPSIPSHP